MIRFLDDKLSRLCQDGSLEDLRSYLEHGIVGSINHGDAATGDTPLHFASSAAQNSHEMAALLLDFGANPSALNGKCETPVHLAAKSGNLCTLKLLVSRGGLSGILNHMTRTGTQNSNSSSRDKIRRHLSSRRRSPSRCRSQPARKESQNLLSVACDSESDEVVEFLIDEIMAARRGCLDEILSGSKIYNNNANFDTVSSSNSSGISMSPTATNPRRGVLIPRPEPALDMMEFLEFTEPRTVVFFELGTDLSASSNCNVNNNQLETSIVGKMLAKTPRAFSHLLDSCIYTSPKLRNKTFVDFFLFHNADGGSELNLLKVIIHFKKFELLTHPICELFLHLKWLRARWFYWIVICLYLIFALLVVAYALLIYGEIGWYINPEGNHCGNGSTPRPIRNDNASQQGQNVKKIRLFSFEDDDGGSLYCIGDYFRIPVLVLGSLLALMQLAKIIQDQGTAFNPRFWTRRPEELTHFLVFALIVLDQIEAIGPDEHKLIAAFLVLCACRITMHTIARDPDIAIFVEMVSNIQATLFKFLLGYIWLFVGWIIAFHVTLGDGSQLGETMFRNSFHDLGSATAKVMAMFTGELGFETAFSGATNLADDPLYNSFVLLLYATFIMEMSVILMNLIIGLAISNIQDLRQNADALRLVKEVLLQRYMESFLRLLSLPCLECGFLCFGGGGGKKSGDVAARSISGRKGLGQMVTNEIFQNNALYCLVPSKADGGLGRLELELIPKKSLSQVLPLETPESKKNKSYLIPSTVQAKLKQLIKGFERQSEEKDRAKDMRNMLKEMKGQMEELKKMVAQLVNRT